MPSGSMLSQKMLLAAAGLAAGVVAGVLIFELLCRCCGWGFSAGNILSSRQGILIASS